MAAPLRFWRTATQALENQKDLDAIAAEQKRCKEQVGHLGHASWQQTGNAAHDGPDREGRSQRH